MLRVVGALLEVGLGLVLAGVALGAVRGRGVLRRVAARRAQAIALTAGGTAIAVWGVGDALRGPEGGVIRLAGLAVLVVAAVVLVATTPAN